MSSQSFLNKVVTSRLLQVVLSLTGPTGDDRAVGFGALACNTQAPQSYLDRQVTAGATFLVLLLTGGQGATNTRLCCIH